MDDNAPIQIENLVPREEMSEHRPPFRESVSWIEGIPFASARLKVYKLKAFNNDLAAYFNKHTEPPIGMLLQASFYLLASFIPSLLLSFIASFLFPKKTQMLPRSGFVFNQ